MKLSTNCIYIVLYITVDILFCYCHDFEKASDLKVEMEN